MPALLAKRSVPGPGAHLVFLCSLSQEILWTNHAATDLHKAITYKPLRSVGMKLDYGLDNGDMNQWLNLHYMCCCYNMIISQLYLISWHFSTWGLILLRVTDQ